MPDVPYPIPALEGDFSLNAANTLSASLLLSSGSSTGSSSSSGAADIGSSPTATTTTATTTTSSSSSSSGGGVWRGLSRLAPTHDLHAGQVAALAAGLGPRAALLEVVVHQHLPIFHTEHCVFCRCGWGWVGVGVVGCGGCEYQPKLGCGAGCVGVWGCGGVRADSLEAHCRAPLASFL